MEKIDKEMVKKEFEQNGYTLIGEYKNYGSPIDMINKDGYKCSLSYGHFKEGNKPVLFGKRCKFQKENIILLLKRNSPNLQFVDCETKTKSGKVRTFVTMICECGKTFEKEFSHIQNDKHLMCDSCAREEIRKIRKKHYNEKYLKNFEKSKYELIDKTQDLYSNNFVEVIEKDTGFKGFVYPNELHKRMIIFSRFHNKKNYIYNVNVLLNKANSKTRAIEFVDDENIKFVCECGKEYIANCRSVECRGKFYCDECTNFISKYELIFKQYLDSIQEEYIREYVFNDCRDIIALPFDFYFNKYNVLVEIDGRQHRYNDYTIKHDKMKNDYCKKHNIPLLRIDYEDIINENYKTIFENFIKPFRE